jgi:hypothetical protein
VELSSAGTNTEAMRGCPHPLTWTRQASWPFYSTWTPHQLNWKPHRFKLETPPARSSYLVAANCELDPMLSRMLLFVTIACRGQLHDAR